MKIEDDDGSLLRENFAFKREKSCFTGRIFDIIGSLCPQGQQQYQDSNADVAAKGQEGAEGRQAKRD